MQSQMISPDDELLEESLEDELLTGERDSQSIFSPQVCFTLMLWKPLALCSPEVCTIEWLSLLLLDESSDEELDDESDQEQDDE